jgi:hypothetical protein
VAEVLLIIQKPGVEASSEEVAAATVASVEQLRVQTVQALETSG